MSNAAPVAAPSRQPVPRTVPPRSRRPLAADLRHPLRPARELARAGLEGTPGRMRVAGAIAVLACAVFGLLGGYAFNGWAGALADARTEADQLVRIQTVQNDLFKADAAASNAYLAGGSGAASTAEDYTAAVEEASRLLAEAAASSPDSAQLADVMTGLTAYTGLVAQARANNIQGLEIGAAYLRQSGEVLRGQIVPALEAISQADQSRVADAYTRMNLFTALIAVTFLLALAALVAVQIWLARRTRRYINVPLAGATVAIVVGVIAGLVTVVGAAQRAGEAADGPYAATVALSAARTAAFDAKAQESLGLIARGDSTDAESVASQRIATAEEELAVAEQRGADAGLSTAFTAWVQEHAAVRAADDGGDWVAAKERALGESNAAFTAFDEVSASALEAQAQQADEALSSRLALVLMSWFTLLLGVGTSVAAMIGIGQRLGEYR